MSSSFNYCFGSGGGVAGFENTRADKDTLCFGLRALLTRTVQERERLRQVPCEVLGPHGPVQRPGVVCPMQEGARLAGNLLHRVPLCRGTQGDGPPRPGEAGDVRLPPLNEGYPFVVRRHGPLLHVPAGVVREHVTAVQVRALQRRVPALAAREDDALEVIPAEAVPARESWLYKNPEALAAVMEGLEQARAGELVEGPDLEASSSVADGIEDE